MRLPHEEHIFANCPKFCQYKDQFEFKCYEDTNLTEAIVVWQELFEFDIPPAIDAGQLKDMIEKWLRTTKLLGIAYPGFVEDPEPYDLYTRVETIVLTEESAQIYFRRVCPLWFILKFAKKCFDKDEKFFDEYPKYLPDIDWLQEKFKKPQGLYEKVEGIIAHFRWEPKKYKGIVPREYFKGMMLPYESDIQNRMFLDFMKAEFPDWRHLIE